MRDGERGFTLIELLVGAAIGAIVILVAVLFVSRLVQWTSALNVRVQSTAAAERLMERMSTEAASAWAVDIPANSNGNAIEFYSQDGSHRAYLWSYVYDPATKMVTRYSETPGSAPQPGEIIGPFDAFTATAIDVTQIGAVDPLFASARATSVRYPLPGTAAVGGNALVELHLRASGVERDELLASENAPTSFTVVVNYTPSPAPVPTPTPPPMTQAPAPTFTP